MARSHEVMESRPANSGLFYGYIVVAAASLTMVVAMGVHYAFGVFFKPLLAEFGWTRAMTSGAFSLSWIMQGLLSVIMGWFNDRYGPRVVLTVCAFLLGLGYLLMSQVGAIWQFYLFYGVMIGTGLGGVYVPLASTVARWFVARRSVMTGIVVAGIGIGTLAGPPVATWLISAYNWRVSYTVLGCVVLVVIALAAQFLRREPAQKGQKPYGESKADEHGLRVSEGLPFGKALCTWQFWMVFGLFLCFGFCLFVIMVHIVPHATDLGISAAAAAGIMSVIGGVSIVGKVVFGNIGDRIGSRQVYIISFIIMAASFLWLLLAREMWMLCLFAAVFALAYAGSSTSQSPLVASLFGLRAHGIILGTVNNGFTLGATLGPIVAGYVFDVSQSYQLAFLISAVIAVAGLIFTVAIKPIGGISKRV